MLPRLLREHPALALCAALGSALLSVWAVFADPVLNNDGVLYVLAATDFRNGDFAAGMALYKWPFYSLLIALVSKVTWLPPEYAAHLLNGVLFALLVLGFLAVVLELDADRPTLILACLIILLLPGLNKFRPFVIRDAGYLAAYLWSLVYLFRYCNHRRADSLVVWAALTVVAILFRVEALALLAVVPMVLLAARVMGWPARLALLGAGAALLVLCCTGLALWSFGPNAGVTIGAFFAQPLDGIVSVWAAMSQEIGFRLQALRLEFLTPFSGDYAPAVLMLTLLVMVIHESLRRLAFVYAAMAWHAWQQRLTLHSNTHRAMWLALILCHLALLCVFTLATMFLASRYAMALVLTVMLLAPFSAADLYRRWKRADTRAWSRWAFPAFIVFALILGADGLDVRTEKSYIRDAGRWLATHAPKETAVYSNNHLVMHYSGRDGLRSGLRHDWEETMKLAWGSAWRTMDYLALEFDRDKLDRERRFVQATKLQPAKVFANSSGDRVSIFEVPPEMRLRPKGS